MTGALLVVLLLTGAGNAPAPGRQILPTPAMPVEDFTTWIVPGDFPVRTDISNYSETTVRLFVNPEGRTTGCKILIASGNPLLDRQACEALARRARFEPARDKLGIPVAGSWTVRKLWLGTVSGQPSAQLPPQQFVPIAVPEMVEVRYEASQSARPSSSPSNWVAGYDPALPHVAGVVEYQLAIDPRGRPTSCTIKRSSGVPKLDEATCNSLIRRARFKPATNAEAEPVAGQWSGRVRWTVPDEPEQTKPG